MNKTKTAKVYSWNEIDTLHRSVAQQIVVSNYKPEVVLGVARCGMVSAVHLAYLLSVRDTGLIYAKTTPTDQILVEKSINPVVEVHSPTHMIKDKKILLVDTVMASGTTLSICINRINEAGVKEVKTAIIINWPNSPYNTSKIIRPKPEFVGETAYKWPDFPWES